jgi:hypothetical protein
VLTAQCSCFNIVIGTESATTPKFRDIFAISDAAVQNSTIHCRREESRESLPTAQLRKESSAQLERGPLEECALQPTEFEHYGSRTGCVQKLKFRELLPRKIGRPTGTAATISGMFFPCCWRGSWRIMGGQGRMVSPLSKRTPYGNYAWISFS